MSRIRQNLRAVPIDRTIEINEGKSDIRILDARPISLP